MKKLILILTIVSFTVISCNQKRELAYFENDYKGLKPGYSNLNDAISVLGEPKEIEETKNGHNYHFEEVVVNISGRDKEHINTIWIVSDSLFSCPKGVVLGDTVEAAQRKVKKFKSGKKYIYDNTNGIIYWHNGNIITKIVLAYRAYK